MIIKRLLIATLAAATMYAQAGLVTESPVVIDMENRVASGNMKSARYSENEFEMIGCGTRTYASLPDGTPSFSFGFCQAQLEDQGNVICFFYDKPEMLQQVQALASNSFVTFRWDENGDCTFIGNSTQSFYLPENKKESKK
ncbi:MAG: hypothetical protein HWE13_00055 [Gammaproteobacteria bacterium]|nr:hypothetical protein [Gammaproteobacteria bacterium]NVK86479.1 hypothetical protein [Gammaproteobacteria bacterium]